MAKDYPIPNDIPVNSTAAKTMQKGVEFVGRYKPTAQRLSAPLPTVEPPAGRESWVGLKYGSLTVVGFLGKGKWLARCNCGYYVTRVNKAILNQTGGRCEDCDYREHIRRRLHFERTGVWLERGRK